MKGKPIIRQAATTLSIGVLLITLMSLYEAGIIGTPGLLTWKSFTSAGIALVGLQFMLQGSPPEAVMVSSLVALVMLGIISEKKAREGFSDANLLAIVFLFAVAKGVDNSHCTKIFMENFVGECAHERTLIFRLSCVVIVVSAVMNNTPVVAMLIPYIVKYCRKHGFANEHILIPLSFSSMVGGVCTLVGTSTNMILNGLLVQSLGPDIAFNMFEMTPIGLVISFCVVLYLSIAAPILLNKSCEDSNGKQASPKAQSPKNSDGEAEEIEDQEFSKLKALSAGMIVIAMLIISAMNVLSLMMAALLAAGALCMLKLLTIKEAFEAVNFGVVVTIAGAYGLSHALFTTNVTKVLGDCFMTFGNNTCDARILLLLFLVTVLFSSMVSNQATVILLFPMILNIAQGNAQQVKQLSMVLMIGASCAFSTPIGYQTNLMVYEPGGYTWAHFLYIGTPLAAIIGSLTPILVVSTMDGPCTCVATWDDTLLYAIYVIAFAGPLITWCVQHKQSTGKSADKNNNTAIRENRDDVPQPKAPIPICSSPKKRTVV